MGSEMCIRDRYNLGMVMARLLSFRARISRHGSVKGKPRYAVLIPMGLSEKLEKEKWIGREVEVIIIESDA